MGKRCPVKFSADGEKEVVLTRRGERTSRENVCKSHPFLHSKRGHVAPNQEVVKI